MFSSFWAGFFPSLWIYLPVVFVVADFQIRSLSGRPVDDEVISVSYFPF